MEEGQARREEVAKLGEKKAIDVEMGATEMMDLPMQGFLARVQSMVNQWDLGAILSAYMSSQGDDAAAFVRPGVDWFRSF